MLGVKHDFFGRDFQGVRTRRTTLIKEEEGFGVACLISIKVEIQT